MRSLAKSVALATIAAASVGACRDWDRFEPVTTGAGGGGANNVGGGGTGPMMTSGMTTTSSTMANTGGNGSGGNGSGGGATDCGTIDVLSDTFDGGSLSWRWGNDTEYFSLQNGELVLLYPATESGFQLQSTAGFDFRDKTMIMEVSTPPMGMDLWLDIAGDEDNYIEIIANGSGDIRYAYEVDGNYLTITGEEFDLVAHRFWRFRESGGTAYYDVSPDGSSWTEKMQFPLAGLFDPEFARVYIGGYTAGTGSPGSARVVDLRSGEPSTGGLCSPTVLMDDFNDGDESQVWNDGWESGSCSISEATGELAITCAPMAYGDAYYGSTGAFDLAGSSVSVEVVTQPSIGSGMWMSLTLGRPEIISLWAFELYEGQLGLFEVVDDQWNEVGTMPYDPNAGRFLRIREEDNVVYFEQSPDNQNYTVAFQRTPPFSVNELKVFLGGGADDNAADVAVAFDNLNLGP